MSPLYSLTGRIARNLLVFWNIVNADALVSEVGAPTRLAPSGQTGQTAAMDQKEEIKAKTDVVDLISEYVPLKQAGSVSWKGLCPFHSEKSPSFHVSRDKQIWHCFGCAEGGDVFAFVMKMEGMDFPEALRHLGNKCGVEVTRFSSADSGEKQRLVGANTFAASYFRQYLLESPAALNARAYLVKRGISEELANQFGLGVAPDAWDGLALAFTKKGLPDTDGERAGLLMRRKQGTGFIDRFRSRIMVPLRDAQGNVVGFTGRVYLPNDPNPAKYMNSPETSVYHKGSILFGLDLAKKYIREKGSVIIVEGNLDVIASHKAGVGNIVASSGTALTEQQLALLKRYTTTIVFSFDADAAGFKAAQRGIALARQAGLNVRVAVLPATAGKDPDEAVQKDPQLWRDAVEKTVPIMQYYIDRAIAGKNLNDVDHKREISAFLLPEFAHIQDVVEREHWLQILADLLRTDMAVLRQAAARPASSKAPAGTPSQTSPLKQVGGVVRPTPVVAAKPSREDQSMLVLAGLFVNKAELREFIMKSLPAEGAGDSSAPLALYTQAVFAYNQQRSSLSTQGPLYGLLQAHLHTLPESQRDLLLPLLDTAVLHAERLAADLPAKDVQGHVRQLTAAVTSSEIHRRRKTLETDLRRAEQAGNQEEVQRLLELYRHLS